jgi:hypothetical protein
MGKKVKKSVRKFQAKGGVSAMLARGTVAKKGKLKRRLNDKNPSKVVHSSGLGEKVIDDEDGVTTATELGEMDMDTFLDSSFLDDDGEEGGEEGISSDDDDEDDDVESVDNNNNGDDDDSVSGPNGDVSSSSDDDLASDEDPDEAERRMMKQMAELAEQDPEFLAHLEKNDPKLLDFGNDSDDEGEEEEEEEEEDEEEEVS